MVHASLPRIASAVSQAGGRASLRASTRVSGLSIHIFPLNSRDLSRDPHHIHFPISLPSPPFFEISIKIKCVTRSCERNAHLFRMLVTVVNAPLKELFTGILERAVSLTASWPWNECATRQGRRRQRLKGPQRQEEWLALRCCLALSVGVPGGVAGAVYSSRK